MAYKDIYKEKEYLFELRRGKLVDELYGPIGKVKFEGEVERVFKDGQKEILVRDNKIRYLYPFKTEEECLSCHTNAKVGDVLGVLDMSFDLSPYLSNFYKGVFLMIILLFPLPILVSYLIATFFSNRLNRSFALLEQNIKEVNRISDLKNIELKKVDLAFGEFNKIKEEVAQLVEKIRRIAVDKEVLEFEIKLLERFVITADVVKDWKEFIKNLLKEVNKIFTVYCLFIVTIVKEENLAIEIFWIKRPSEQTKDLMERIILEYIESAPPFKDTAQKFPPTFSHEVVSSNENYLKLEEEELLVQTKVFLLEKPLIGGIVGIGVNADIADDPVRTIGLEGVLSMLVNVIVSAKAIYEYTKEIEYFATRDPLTDLFNKRVFWELLAYEIEKAKRHNHKFTLMFIDLDDFKLINDIYGHLFGDNFLRLIGKIIKENVRREDIVCRFGGDEFVCILSNADIEQAYLIANRVRQAIKEASLMSPKGVKVTTTSSMGLAVYPDHGKTPKDLFTVAEHMAVKAKALGKDKILFPSIEDLQNIFKFIDETLLLINKAIYEKNIFPYFQPIIKLDTLEIFGYEALMRIATDNRIVSAGEFIEYISNLGIIGKVDLLLVEKVFEKIKENQYKDFIFINTTPKVLVYSEYLQTLKSLINTYQIDSQKIVFEITERETVKNVTLLKRFLKELKDLGCLVAIDDFGSGYSTFHYIKLIPVDFVKIEGEFIRSLVSGEAIDRSIVESIVTFCKGTKIRTIAEYVESEEIL
ncbi:MAG: bifunctional diguanylate cyclase/phosphodiesterase, partial [Candidatus Omnitrophica bacterium]|nr:bifunctional diguanylate cyclase/phosphodiesterase [Candidatus Omnitrophota bacterium]